MTPSLLPDLSSARASAEYFGTIGIQLIIFLLVLLVLNLCVLRPSIRMLHVRKKRMEVLEAKARELEIKNGQIKEEYGRRLDGSRKLAEEKKEVAKLAGHRHAEMIVSETRKEAIRDQENIIKEAEKNCKVATPVFENEIKIFAKEIASKIVNPY